MLSISQQLGHSVGKAPGPPASTPNLLIALAFRFVGRRNERLLHSAATERWRKGRVRSIPNVLLRGNVFHFRRAVPVYIRHKLRRTELTCTLKTCDASSAKLKSRALYIASEHFFKRLHEVPMLSDEQLSLIVRDFYETIIRQENALRLNGQPLSEEARQARIAHYKEVSERTKQSLGGNHFADAAFVSDAMLRKHKLSGTLKRNEINQVRQAILRAGIDLADHMKARYEGDFNRQPQDQLLKAQLVNLSTIQESPITKTPASKPPGPLISELSKQFLGRQVETRAWEKQTANQAEKSFDLFIEINGDLPIEAYTREHAARFKEVIQRLPANYGKAGAYRGLSLDAIIETVSGTIANKTPALTQKTVKRHFSALSTLWGALISEGRRTENIFTGFKFGNSKRANEQRDMWTEDELRALFSTPVWRGCKSAWHCSAPGLLLIRDDKFWIPLIAIFSGLRQEEICQLHIQDVRQEDGIWYFDINNRPPRQLKNRSAVRRVPIHDELIRISLLDYYQNMRQTGEERIFPQLKPGGANGRLGHGFTKWFIRYRRETKVYRPRLDFHSFRHSATTFLQRAEVPVPIIDELVGHTGTGETARYTKGLGLAKLHSAINKLSIGVNLTALHSKPA